jgi:hypothetical protein
MDTKTLFAYAMLWWILACSYYMVVTHGRDVGTPLHDSLTTEQLLIKEKSKRVRKIIFYQGAVVTTIFTMYAYSKQIW